MITQTKREIVKGIAASDGIAIGPIFFYTPPHLEVPKRAATDAKAEFARFQAACAQADIELARLKETVHQRAGAEAAGIFDAHRMLLADPTLHEMIKALSDTGKNAEAAVVAAADELAAEFAAMEDELFAARAADVRDLARRVLRILLDVPDTSLGALAAPSIIVAHDLSPSDTAGLDPTMTLGLCTAAGGKTSHSAILARTLGIPAVVGIASAALEPLETGMAAALNGAEGTLILDPSAAEVVQMRQAQNQRQKHLDKMQLSALAEARTADGKRVEVAANIG